MSTIRRLKRDGRSKKGAPVDGLIEEKSPPHGEITDTNRQCGMPKNPHEIVTEQPVSLEEPSAQEGALTF